MKLIRFGEPGAERPGLIDAQGHRRDLSGVIPDVHPGTLSRDTLRRLASLNTDALPRVADDVRLGPCVGEVGNVIGIGLNYADHAAEAGLKPPAEPIVFNKHNGAISGPDDDILLPPGAAKLDWEVELAVVMAHPTWHVSRGEALSHVAGYCLANDVSERSYQMEREGQWVKGKSYPSHCPMGPWLVTTDELTDPQAVDLWLEVNGVRRQQGSTRTMIFDVATLVSCVSQFMRLQPGDLILTGTPPGLGMGQKPPVYLKPGDEVRLGSPHLGVQRQRVRPSPHAA